MNLLEFIQLPESERTELEHSAKWFTINIPIDLKKLPFENVKELQSLIQQEQTYQVIIEICAKGCTQKIDSLNSDWKITLTLYHRIIEAIKAINELEDSALGGYIPTPKEVSAGIDVFNKYGAYNQIRSVAIELGLKPIEVEQMSYERVFTELCYQKDSRDFMRKLNKND